MVPNWCVQHDDRLQTESVFQWVSATKDVTPSLMHRSYLFLALTHFVCLIAYANGNFRDGTEDLHDITKFNNPKIYHVSCYRIKIDPLYQSNCSIKKYANRLKHWGRDKIATILETTFSNAFSLLKMNEFRLIFYWSLFLRFKLTILQHWSR